MVSCELFGCFSAPDRASTDKISWLEFRHIIEQVHSYNYFVVKHGVVFAIIYDVYIKHNPFHSNKSINPRNEYQPSLAHRNAKTMLNHNTKRKRRNHGRTSLRTSFCDGVRLAGNRTLTRTTRSPRSVGFLDIVIPKPGNRSS